jgi:pimeloyl-ACP methyl ester carboxylesterase
MAGWIDRYWLSKDGLRLHCRDYISPENVPGRPPIICVPGLTRNARDFEGLAGRLASPWRVICVDLRGRGESASAPDPMSYAPATYVEDLEALFDHLRIERAYLFGTSLGALVTLMLAARPGSRVAAALINDIGPEIDPRGLARIMGYVGRSQNWPTWLHAARYFGETQGFVYPRWGIEDWIVHAKRLCRLSPGGRIILDYDMRIAEPLRTPPQDAPPTDLWSLLDGLSGIPSLVVRGALSDILSGTVMARMAARVPTMETVTIADVGHAPTLEEPEALDAIGRLLECVGSA